MGNPHRLPDALQNPGEYAIEAKGHSARSEAENKKRKKHPYSGEKCKFTDWLLGQAARSGVRCAFGLTASITFFCVHNLVSPVDL